MTRPMSRDEFAELFPPSRAATTPEAATTATPRTDTSRTWTATTSGWHVLIQHSDTCPALKSSDEEQR